MTTARPAGGIAAALAELGAGRSDAAEALGRALLRKTPRDPAVHQLLAAIALRRGRLEEASRWAASCLELRTDHLPALLLAGRAAHRAGDPARAAKFFRRAAALAPDQAEPAFMACIALRECGDPEAGLLLQHLLRRFPRHAPGWHELGLTLQKAGQPEAALVAFARAAKAEPNAAYSLCRAMALQSLGRPGEAAAAYREALRLSPGSAEAAIGLAACLRQTGDLEAARSELEAIVARHAGNDQAWFLLGQVREDLRDPAGAAAAYRQAVEARPDFPEAHVNLGLRLQRAGDLDAAKDHYRRAMRLRADTFAHIAQALPSGPKGELWLDLEKLRRSLGA